MVSNIRVCNYFKAREKRKGGRSGPSGSTRRRLIALNWAENRRKGPCAFVIPKRDFNLCPSFDDFNAIHRRSLGFSTNSMLFFFRFSLNNALVLLRKKERKGYIVYI